MDTIAIDDKWFVIILVVVGCLTGATIALAAIFASLAGAMHRKNSEAMLKRDLLDRGMSADEVAKVIEAPPPTDFLERWAKNRKP